MTRSVLTHGYSGRPLSQKLGIKAGHHVLLIAAPDGYCELLLPLPDRVVFERVASTRVDLVQVFVTQGEDLSKHLSRLRQTLRPDAAIWISWPKKSSGVASTVSEDTIRALALPLGLVDIKVCAVDAVWSGLKLVVRRALRE